MDADPYTLPKIFRDDVRYEVPEFQRRYVWTSADQWEPLWSDVRNCAEDFLRAGGHSPGESPRTPLSPTDIGHFLGALVVQKGADTLSDIRTRKVIDGQQRMITLQLMLSAVELVFAESHADLSERIGALIRNDESLTDGDPAMQNKVWPTHPDRDSYRAAMSGKNDGTESRVSAAHRYFEKEIRLWLKGGEAAPAVWAKALERALMRGVKLVVIDIEANEDEHLIYETLNARGTPLLAWDLVKNVIVNRASEEQMDPEAILDSHLRGFDDQWWDQEVGSGRNRRSRADTFLSYWLIMRTGSDVPTRQSSRIMRAFSDHAADERKVAGVGIVTVAEELGKDGGFFRALEHREDGGLDPELRRGWRGTNVGVFAPVLLWLHSQRLEDEEVSQVWKACESYFVRRMACGLTSRGYFDLMISVMERFHSNSEVDPLSVAISCLAERETDRYRWPSDSEFAKALIHESKIGQLASYQLKMVLYRIEDRLRTRFSEPMPPDVGLTVEHLMPVDWRSHWPTPRGRGRADESASDMRNRYVQTIGNLTLLSDRLNSSVSNGAWKSKVRAMKKHSTLRLNADVVENHPRSWTESDIEERSERLAELAVEIWPGPDKF